MQKIILGIAFILISLGVTGQLFPYDAASGKPYMLTMPDDIRGTPYLFEDWKPGNVTDNSGTTFLNVMVRFDAYTNKFIYNHGDTAYEFVTVINEVELFPFSGSSSTKMVFKKGFTDGGKLSADKFVQVLTEGKITAVKYIYKTMIETTEYSVPGKIKTLTSSMLYFFIKDGKAVSQKPNAKLLEELLKDNWPVVASYMKQHSLSPKSEDDCIKIIGYYNTL